LKQRLALFGVAMRETALRMLTISASLSFSGGFIVALSFQDIQYGLICFLGILFFWVLLWLVAGFVQIVIRGKIPRK
jgi:hypothetical protein